MSIPYNERCEAETNRFQIGARGSKLYARCKKRAIWRQVLGGYGSVADPGRTRMMQCCGTHAKLHRQARLVESESRI